MKLSGLLFSSVVLLSSCGSIDGSQQGPGALRVLQTDPQDGALAYDGVVTITFDKPLAGETVAGAIRLVSANRAVSLATRVDQQYRQLQIRPQTALIAGLSYRLLISTSLRSIDGRRPADPLVFSFTAHAESAGLPATPTPPTLPLDLFVDHCAPCHNPRRPAGGLDLSTESALRQTALNVRSRQLPLTLIEPRRHDRSYLVRKMLFSGGIRGEPMPPAGPLAAAQLRAIIDWIDSGASE
ncbi:MAG: Ig-like domain-containing protein [Deltaproteobacteria bacterium]|nr:Ig-like domain-containing protein [Deltaproteobacteria bacterium]